MIYYIEKDKPSYKEPPKEVCFYAYKRINHFREILAQFQAKETTQIPDKIISDVKVRPNKNSNDKNNDKTQIKTGLRRCKEIWDFIHTDKPKKQKI